MDTWNREDLYAEVWEQPLVRVAAKYGISAVMLGKVCRKLQIPLPGRGYWTKKEFGKPVERTPLKEARDIPVVHCLKQSSPEKRQQTFLATPELTDPEYQRVLEVEGQPVVIDPDTKRHKLVSATAKALRHAQPDNRGIILRRWDETCLDVRVSKNSLDRALNILNAVILLLEAEAFPVTVHSDRHGTVAQVFGYAVPFSIVEKLREMSRKEVKGYSYTRMVIEYQPSRELEFRVEGNYYGYRKFRDGKKQKLEGLIPKLAGAVVREGRARVIWAEKQRLEEIERSKKEQQRAILAEQIAEEEKKVRDLESWVTNWERAERMREFIVALEKYWKEVGHDLSPESPKGKRVLWMKRQADRLDPIVESPASILDRKNELNRGY
jgi:hypothetical protein